MSCIDNNVVGDVGVQRHLVVLCRRVDVNSSGVVTKVVVRDRQQLRVLHVEVHDAHGRVVQHPDAAVLHVVGLERYPRIGLADVLENETARVVPRHCIVSDSLQLAGAFAK